MAQGDPLKISLQGTSKRFEQASQSVLAAFAASGINPGNQVTPAMLVDGIRQLFAVMQKLDDSDVWDPALPEDNPEQIGDYAIGFLMDLSTWADRLNERQAKQSLDIAAVGVAAWVIRHDGSIRTLEPIVNGLAALANVNQDPGTLLLLAQMMEKIIHAAEAQYAADLESDNPGRPWRILLLNHGIAATRANDAQQMEHAFELLLHFIPADARVFFEEGMRQISQGDFSPAARDVMRAFQQKTSGTMH